MPVQAVETVSVDPTLSSEPHALGLGALLAGKGALPLRSCRVRAELVGGMARTTVVQTYENVREQPIEAVHIFPVSDRAAVVSVVLSAGEVRVTAECRERAQAEAAFAAARRGGHRAVLLTQEREDVHTLRVTNLPPETSVQVEMVIEEALEVVDGRVLYRFPTTIAPRYTPGEPLGHFGPGVSPDTDIVMDASRLTPPLRLSGGTRLDLEVVVHGTVRRVSSSLHAVSMALEDGAVRVAPSAMATLDRDFVLAVTFGLAERAGARAWTDGEHTLLVLEPPTDAMPPSLPRDAVFVIDISGSMAGRKLEAAKLALKTAIHGLLPQDRFLLIAFDNRLEMLESRFLPVDDRSIAAADQWVDGLSARGGTVMAPALERALSVEATPEGRQRTVLFVTDGQSTDEERLMQLLWQRKGSARIFPLGIDTAVNSALLRRMARVGGGVCELTAPTADIEAVVARLEARFGAPLVEGARVEGGTPARSPLPALFSGRPATILLEGGEPTVNVAGTSSEGTWTVSVVAEPAPFPLGPAWARARVAALEDRLIVKPFEEDALRPELVRVALAHGVASRWTAFVAVDTSVTVDGRPLEVVQPMEPPTMSRPHGLPLHAMSAAAAPAFFARSHPVSAAMMTGALPPPSPAPMDVEDRSPPIDASVPPAASARGFGLFEQVRKAMVPRRRGRGGASDGSQRSGPVAESVQAAPPVARPGSAPVSYAPGAIARRQSADGSFSADLIETLLCLLVLMRAGHTRRMGLRRRVVTKAVIWLSHQPADARIEAALALLARVEQGEPPSPRDWQRMGGLIGDAGERLWDGREIGT